MSISTPVHPALMDALNEFAMAIYETFGQQLINEIVLKGDNLLRVGACPGTVVRISTCVGQVTVRDEGFAVPRACKLEF